MLIKLLKYDSKAVAKLLVPGYIILALLAVIARATNAISDKFNNNIFIFTANTSQVFLAFGIVFILVATLIIDIFRYRNNLLKDEGYLMHTLPVTVSQLFYSKFIMTMISLIASAIVSYLTWAFAVWDLMFFKPIFDMLQIVDFEKEIIMVIIYAIIAILALVFQIFVSLSVGHTMNGNRDLMSFLAFLVTYIINQVSGAIALLYAYVKNPEIFNSLNNDSMPFDIFTDIFVAAGVMMILISIVYQIISIKVLKNNLNLE